MQIQVYKFGGASLANIDRIKSTALFLKKERAQHQRPIVVVVSAMGKTTDEFIQLAQTVAARPKRRELDMLLTSGERISMALLSLALNDLGLPAISLTGSQAGILTDHSHGNARIENVKPYKLEHHLQQGNVVVLAGFQGVSHQEKEVTTLGRGGSDTTAVAITSYFKGSSCEFKKDVGGIFSADPKIVPHTRHLPQLTYKNLMDMTFWGSKVVHYRAAELAYRLNIPLKLSHFDDPEKNTLINGEIPMIEQQRILSINSHKAIHKIFFKKTDLSTLLPHFFNSYKEKELPYPQLLTTLNTNDNIVLLVVGEGSASDYKAMGATHFETLSSITLTCFGAVASDLLPQVMKQVQGYKIYEVLQDSTNLTLICDPENREKIISQLHTLISTQK